MLYFYSVEAEKKYVGLNFSFRLSLVMFHDSCKLTTRTGSTLLQTIHMDRVATAIRGRPGAALIDEPFEIVDTWTSREDDADLQPSAMGLAAVIVHVWAKAISVPDYRRFRTGNGSVAQIC